MVESINCQHCRTDVPGDAAHCPNCGQPMPRHVLPRGTVVCEDYQLVRMIGYGGMGEVYLAQHNLTGQLVAVKSLAMHLAEEVDLRIRFLDEARILARLDHPNIVMLHNFKQEQGRMLILMQYVDGESLDHILAREGSLAPERAAVIFAPLCDALNHAHEKGIIHRDLKPSNILVDASGKARITDFGIAKLTEGGANLTRTGTRVGTSWFMSPEQGLNKPATLRSDIYALGVSLYNALSGRLPFSGDSEYEVIKGHVEKPPPPIFDADSPALARALQQVAFRALEKRPEDRYESGNAMRDGILDALARHGQGTEAQSAAAGAGAGMIAITQPGGSAMNNAPTEVLNPPTNAAAAGGRPTRNTPPLGHTRPPLSDTVAEQRAPVTLATPPMPSGVPRDPPASADQPPATDQPPAHRLMTPTGRPAAPGMRDSSGGILRDKLDEQAPQAPAYSASAANSVGQPPGEDAPPSLVTPPGHPGGSGPLVDNPAPVKAETPPATNGESAGDQVAPGSARAPAQDPSNSDPEG